MIFLFVKQLIQNHRTAILLWAGTVRSLLSSNCFGSSFWKSGTSVWMYASSSARTETADEVNWPMNHFRIIFSNGRTLFLYPSDSCTLLDGLFEETAESGGQNLTLHGSLSSRAELTKCEGGLLGWTCRLCLSEIALNLPLLLEDIFAGYRIKKWQFFLLAHLNSSFCHLLASAVLIN